MVEKWKTKAMMTKRQKAKKGINLSSKKKEKYESDIRDKTDSNQADNDKNLL